jgi:hypothetical protein
MPDNRLFPVASGRKTNHLSQGVKTGRDFFSFSRRKLSSTDALVKIDHLAPIGPCVSIKTSVVSFIAYGARDD